MHVFFKTVYTLSGALSLSIGGLLISACTIEDAAPVTEEASGTNSESLSSAPLRVFDSVVETIEDQQAHPAASRHGEGTVRLVPALPRWATSTEMQARLCRCWRWVIVPPTMVLITSRTGEMYTSYTSSLTALFLRASPLTVPPPMRPAGSKRPQ